MPDELEEKIRRAMQLKRELPPPRAQVSPEQQRPAAQQPPVEHYTQLPYWVRDERPGSATYGQLIVNPKYEDIESGIQKPAFRQGTRSSDDYFAR